MLRRHPRALAALAVAVLAVAGTLFRLSPMWPGPALPAGATRLALATEPAHPLPAFGCTTAALAPVRIAVRDSALVFIGADGERAEVVWPSGWAAWIRNGRAELVDRNGTVVGREGDVIEGFLGGVTGTDNAFHVCVFWN